jgi:predicted permease
MRRPDPLALRICGAAFRAGTALLPPGFRRRGEVAATFREEAAECLAERGLRGLGRLWLSSLADLLRVAAAEWTRPSLRPQGTKRRPGLLAGGDVLMDALIKDVRYSLHALRRNSGFALAAILTLGVGIGLNTAQFSIVDSVLWRPLPVEEPERLGIVFATGREPGYGRFSFPDYRDLSEAAAFESLAASTIAGVTLRSGDDARTLFGQAVTSNYFDTLRPRLALGRFFGSEVELSGEHAGVVVVSHGAWRGHFGSDGGIVGRTIDLNGAAFTVVGVAGERFRGCYNFWFAPEFWVPIRALPLLDRENAASLEERGASFAHIVGRLRDEATFAEAEAQTRAIAEQLAKDYPATNRDRVPQVLPELATRPEADTAHAAQLALGVFQALAGLVLLVACANVSNLLLARAAGRRREIAVRFAVGASRGRLVRQLLTEGLVLSGLAAVLGVALALLLVRRLAGFQMPTYFPLALDLRLDVRSLGFAILVATLTALAFALVPALRAAGTDLVPALKGDSARGGSRSRLMGTLVAGQVAVSLVLLVAGGLFMRSMREAERVPLGFRTDHALLATLNLDQPGYDQARRQRLLLDLAERVAALPDVSGASYAAPLPMEFSSGGGLVYPEGREPSGEEGGERLPWTHVGPDYFEVMETRIVTGRPFDRGDDGRAGRVAIVNQTFAETYWPGQNPIGRKLRFGSPDAEPVEVVGVAQNGKYRAVVEPPMPYAYRPLLQGDIDGPTLIVRTLGEPETSAPAVRAALRALDPAVPLLEVKTLDDLIEGRAMIAFRLGAGLSGSVGLLALGLAVVGLYGIVTLGVTRRTREIGIRMALGAERRRVVGMLLGQGMRLVAVGAAVGTALALLVGRALGGLLVGVAGADPATFATVLGALVAVAAVATWLPSRRAARVDPARALRTE